jgi:hypothetical protein
MCFRGQGSGGSKEQAALKNRERKATRVTDLPASCFFVGRFLRSSGHIFKNVLMVFLSSSCRETTKKRDEKIKGKTKKMTGDKAFSPVNFFGNKFLPWTIPKSFLPWTIPKAHKKKVRKKSEVPTYLI